MPLHPSAHLCYKSLRCYFAKEVRVMADSCLNFAQQETEGLDKEIEALQVKIRLHNQTKDAWDTIQRNAANESQAGYLDLANSETARLNGEIEAVEEAIRRHTEIKAAWNTITHNTRSESRVYQGVTYVKGEDGQWHQQRLDMEIEALQARIHLHNQTKDAWDRVVQNAASVSQADCLELANSETARLNAEIDVVQQEISRRLETRNAWDTLMRNAVTESRIFQGARYVRGWDGQWHLQQTQASELNEDRDPRWANNSVSKPGSVRQALMHAVEKTFGSPQKNMNHLTHGKEEFQSLGLR